MQTRKTLLAWRADLRAVQTRIVALQDEERRLCRMVNTLSEQLAAEQETNFKLLDDNQKAEIRQSISEADTSILGEFIAKLAEKFGISPSQAWSLIPKRKK